MPASSPISSARPRIDLYLDIVGTDVDSGNVGRDCVEFDWKGMMNGGYMVHARLNDANYNILKKFLIELEYFRKARSTVFRATFRLRWPDTDNQTPWQVAYVISLHAEGATADLGTLRFTAIDPPSWHLNAGDASGKVYRGKTSDAIKQVVQDYAPGIGLDITSTTDSDRNQWWMMRQDPKTFISSMLDWSCSLTPRQTQWIVSMDGTDMRIKEQAEISSDNVGFYRGPHRNTAEPHVQNWEVLADNALSLVNTKLVTQGISAISGQYLDRITDAGEQKLFVKDARTPNKYKARASVEKAFTKPPDAGPPRVGWTAIHGIPEVYSAGDLGKKYDEYIDGRPRAMWLNMANMVQRVRFSVLGHGIYYNCEGLGTNTITIQWLDIDNNPFFLAGNWIIYGFWHQFRPAIWLTHLYCARFDWDAAAIAVPAAGGP